MENVMMNGFAELSSNEMEEIDGGINVGALVAGVAVGVAVAAACVMAGPVIVASAAAYGYGCALAGFSAISGGLIGYGFYA